MKQYHIGALGSLLDGLKQEAGRLAVVLPDEAAVREHRREVVGEDASLERQDVATLRRPRLELGLLLPHRCAHENTHFKSNHQSANQDMPPPHVIRRLTDGVELLERGGAAGDGPSSAAESPPAQPQRRRGRRDAQGEHEAGHRWGINSTGPSRWWGLMQLRECGIGAAFK